MQHWWGGKEREKVGNGGKERESEEMKGRLERGNDGRRSLYTVH